MKIAVYVDAEGEVARVTDRGAILLFGRGTGTWTVRKTIRFGISTDASLATIQAGLAAAVAAFEDCSVFLSKDVRGVVNSILQEMGIRTWQSNGPLFTQLETVARKEDERLVQEAAAARKERRRCRRRRHHLDGTAPNEADVRPTPVGAPELGHYRLDLVDALLGDPSLNSWDALIPFLTGTPFRRLDLVCDHLPRWLSRAMRALDMGAEVEPAGPGDPVVRVTIMPRRAQAEAVQPVRPPAEPTRARP